MGFVRFDRLDRADEAFTYLNPLSDLHAGLQTALEHKLQLSYAIYEPGFTRLGAALAGGVPGLPAPLYRFMFSDEFAWGFPPKPTYLDAQLALLAEAAPGATWMVAGLGVDVRPLIPHAVARGGHVRVGLEDAPWGSTMSNSEWVHRAVALVREAGAEPASAGEVRRVLKA